jgi:hypothetical protein
VTLAYVTGAANTTASGPGTITLPSGILGGDMIYIAVSVGAVSESLPVGWTMRVDASPSSTEHVAWYAKEAAGTVGSPSSDVGVAVAITPAVSCKIGVVALIYRDNDLANTINAAPTPTTYSSTGSPTTFAGPNATTTVDGTVVLSIIGNKNSIASAGVYTPPSGYTTRQQAIFATGTGKCDIAVAEIAGGSAGTVAGGTWTVNGTPGSTAVMVVALSPVSTTQWLHPIADITKTNVTGVSDNSTLYTNIDETGTVDLTDYVEFIVTGDYNAKHSTGADPGTKVGWQAKYTLGLDPGTTSTTWTINVYEGTTLRSTWTETVTADPTDITHTITTSDLSAVTTYDNLRVEAILTAAS